jgi:hypothetical protein
MDQKTSLSSSRVTLGAVGLVVCSAALLGCPNPNTYGVPRTVPAGKVSHTVSLEAFNYSVDQPRPAPGGGVTTTREGGTLPMLPSYSLRIGAADRIDVGIQLKNLSTLGADLKWNFLKTSSFDMAIDPGFQFLYYSIGGGGSSTSVLLFYGHLPLLLGVNLGETATLVFSPGAVFVGGSTSQTTNNIDSRDAAFQATGVWGRFGVGVNIRASEKFAIHPEVTGMRAFDDLATLMIVFGVGFSFGRLPSYAPGSENDPPEQEWKGAPPAQPGPAPAPEAPPAAQPAPG